MSFKEWEKLIVEFKKSGKSQAQWCREKDLKVKAFNYQYRKYRRLSQDKNTDNQINWVSVKIEPLISLFVKLVVENILNFSYINCNEIIHKN